MTPTASASDLLLQDAVRDARDGVFVLNTEQQLVFFSPGCERLTGLPASRMARSLCPCRGLPAGQDESGTRTAETDCPAHRILSGELPAARRKIGFRNEKGLNVWVDTRYSPIRAADGSIRGVLGIMREVRPPTAVPGALQGAEADVQGVTPFDGNAEASPNSGVPLDQKLAAIEQQEIIAALNRVRGRRADAARMLGISRSRLYRRMRALGIETTRSGRRLET